MIKIEQLYVDLGPIPGNIYDPGTRIKSELEVARGGFETVSNIQAPTLMSPAQLSPQMEQKELLLKIMTFQRKCMK